MRSIAPKITLAFLFAIIITLLLYSLILNQAIDEQFNLYIQANQDNNNKNIVNALTHIYKEKGYWDKDAASEISTLLKYDGINLRLYDNDGFVIWNSIASHSDLAYMFTFQLEENITSSLHPIVHQNRIVAHVEISYAQHSPITELDTSFRDSINKSLVSIAIFATLFAIFLSIILSSSISAPLSKITNIATNLSKGDLKQRIQVKKGDDEIARLAKAINHLAETLEKEENYRKNITADIAHELRTPLMSLQGQIEAMADRIVDPTPDNLNSTVEEVIRLSSLIKSLELLSTAESATLEFNPELISLTDVTKNIVNVFQAQYQAKGVMLSFYAIKKCYILADKDKLSQIIINLLSNSLKYSQAKDRVTVKISYQGDDVTIRITDTGMGISEHDLPYIFDRFYRGDKSRNRNTGGSGIGLAIVKSLVDAHKWNISVSSSLGKGTSFTITIPRGNL